MACGSCKTCAARCSNHPASYGHTPSRRPSPMISQKPSEPLHNLTLKPEPALADLHRIPDATVPTFAIGHGCAAGWDTDRKTSECLRVKGESLPAVDTPSITPQVFRRDGTELRVPMAPLSGLVPGQDGIS